jgi:hypothetical protein
VNSDSYHSPLGKTLLISPFPRFFPSPSSFFLLEESEDPEVSDEYLEELSRNAEREALERAGFSTGSDTSGDVEMQTISSSATPYSSSSSSLSPSSTRLFSSSSSSPLVTRKEGEDIEMDTQR